MKCQACSKEWETTDECLEHYRDCFEYYAPRVLKIRSKDKGVIPFTLNDAQIHLHKIAERQLKKFGWVRIIVLKGRQQGCSTYIEGRFYWKASHQKGQRVYILTHESDATSNLFDMVSRYHENCPTFQKPQTDKDSGKELKFSVLDSGFRVGTAGTKGTGRSSTIQYFHGSEVAFWPHASTHATGVMQAIPSTSGEAFLESTSDGMGNYFHQTWVKAVAGLNNFIPVFIPWFWQSEYALKYKGEQLDDDELDYQKLHRNQDGSPVRDGHMLWRRQKIAELDNGEDDFKREYPATPQEAFESAGYRQLIQVEDVMRAISNSGIEARGSMVMGVDPARFGDDRLALAFRRGRVVYDVVAYTDKMDQMEIAGLVRQILDSVPIDRCFIDVGMGVGVIDRLHEMNYVQVQGVDFGSRAFNQVLYTNRRNEMWQEMGEWFKDDHVQLFTETTEELETKTDAVTMDLCSVEYKFNSRNVKVLEDKDATKKRLGLSPDMGDALALTFAEPVAEYWSESEGDPDKGRDDVTGY